MLNYSSIIKILESDQYVDKTDCFESFVEFGHHALDNCKGTGSSLFLKTLACFLDETIDTKDVFNNLKIAQSGTFAKEINKYCVLWIDFSDFNAETFEEALGYIKEKMSEVYKQFYNCFEFEGSCRYDHQLHEKALDIIEGTVNNDDLQYSLHRLLRQLKDRHHPNGHKLAFLVDNMVLLESVADEKGYAKEMKTFLHSFLVEDMYKHTDIFLLISDYPENDDEFFQSNRHEFYRYLSVVPFDIRWQHSELIVAPECLCNFDYSLILPDTRDWTSLITKGRHAIRQAKNEEEKKHQEHIRQEKARFAEELSTSIPLFSPNLGIREKHLNKSSSKYTDLNNLLRDIYVKSKPDFSRDKIYSLFQKLDKKKSIVEDTDNLLDILNNLPEQNSDWDTTYSAQFTGCWIQVIYGKKGKNRQFPNKPGNIKVYACFNNTDIQSIFVDSLKNLLKNASDSFAAKIATFNRSDQMCYWISTNDFIYLEHFFRPYFNDMVKTLPFISYKGRLGISKDFPGVDDSHNSIQAHIIADYLKTTHCVDEVDLEDMYNNYIAKWNGDIYEETDYGGFKNCSALSFVVILDTLDAILANTEFTEDSLLLSDDERLWNALASSRCWADVNEKWNQNTIMTIQRAD